MSCFWSFWFDISAVSQWEKKGRKEKKRKEKKLGFRSYSSISLGIEIAGS